MQTDRNYRRWKGGVSLRKTLFSFINELATPKYESHGFLVFSHSIKKTIWNCLCQITIVKLTEENDFQNKLLGENGLWILQGSFQRKLPCETDITVCLILITADFRLISTTILLSPSSYTRTHWLEFGSTDKPLDRISAFANS